MTHPPECPIRPLLSLYRRIALLPCVVAALATVAGPAQAQAPLVLQQRLPELGRSVAATDDSTALVLNPANLAFLPGRELRWTGTFSEDRVRVPLRGHAFSLGLPLPFSLSTGLRLDVVDPPPDTDLGLGVGPNSDYQWLTWGLALRSSKAMSLGFSLERSFSRGQFGGGLSSYSFGASFRWLDELGVSAVAQNVNGPSNAAGILGASYTAAIALRPWGTRAVELGLEAKFIDDDDVWIPRATLGVDVPYVGRLRGEFNVVNPSEDDRTWLASLGLAVYLNQNRGSTEVAMSGLLGNGLGVDDSLAAQSAIALKGFPEPVGLEFGRYGVRVRIERTPEPREHVRLLRGLWSLAEEERVDAVVLELRASPAQTLAHVQELRDAVHELRRAGKRVLCHVEDGAGSALYLCAAANRILINPAGNLRLAGLRTRYLYFARLLDKLGIQAEVIHVGEHKSAPESFTREGASEVARADKIDLLQQTERQFTEGVALGRDMSFAAVRAAVKRGPFLAPEVVSAGLADALAFDDQIDREVSQLVGRPTRVSPDNRRAPAPLRFAEQPSIALVYVEGDMVDGRSRRVPIVGADVAGSYTIAEALRRARESALIRAVVLRVETPGGSSTAADVIWRQVYLTSRVKPVVVSMGGYAASGGYYVSAPGTRIYANPLTLTGSIGVFYGKADVGRLLDRIGVDVEVYKTGESADVDSMYRPFSPSERQHLQRNLEQAYGLFLDRVANGRKLDRAKVDEVARGRVWTGEQARDRGLVDELGGLRQALAHARKLAGLRDDAPIVELPKVQGSLLGQLLGVPGLSVDELEPTGLEQVLPREISQTAAALLPFAIHRPDVPLMRLDFAVLD